MNSLSTTLNSSINSFNPKWNKFPQLRINHFEYSQDKKLLIIATNNGYRIYETQTFSLISSLDSFQEMIGNISKASILYSSKLICFLPEDSNQFYNSKTIIFFDDSTRKNLGLINCKERIFNFFLTRYLIFLIVWNKIYVFELKTLKFIFKINNIDIDENLISIEEDYNNENNYKLINLAVLPLSFKENNIIMIYKLLISDTNNELIGQQNLGIITNFKNIKKIELKSKDKIIVLSQFGNKIHIYNCLNNDLLYCIYLGNKRMNVTNFSFDVKEKFLMFLLDFDEINIYKLNVINDKFKCKCHLHSDNEVKIRRKSSNNSFLGGFFNRLVEDFTEPFLYKIIETEGTNFKLEFDSKNKNQIYLISNIGITIIYNFDRKKGKLNSIKQYDMFEEDLDEN